jgi:hypothetical protein
MSNAQLTIESLAVRINRQSRSMQAIWTAIAVLVIFVIAYTEMRKPDTIRASTLDADSVIAGTVSVKNNMGEIVALLSSSSDGSPRISLFDRKKKLRMSISLKANGGPSIALHDADSGNRAVLSLNDRQEPSLALFNEPSGPNDQKGPQRALLGVDTGGSGYLALYGTAGGLSLFSSDGRVRWTPNAGTPQDLLQVK